MSRDGLQLSVFGSGPNEISGNRLGRVLGLYPSIRTTPMGPPPGEVVSNRCRKSSRGLVLERDRGNWRLVLDYKGLVRDEESTLVRTE